MELDASGTDADEPPAELRRAFWTLVVIVDVAMIAVALGVLFLVVDGRPLVGGVALAVGLLGFAETYRRIRVRRNT